MVPVYLCGQMQINSDVSDYNTNVINKFTIYIYSLIIGNVMLILQTVNNPVVNSVVLPV